MQPVAPFPSIRFVAYKNTYKETVVNKRNRKWKRKARKINKPQVS
jgi:hypothetical protein